MIALRRAARSFAPSLDRVTTRRETHCVALSREDRLAADAFVSTVARRFGERLDRIILYGSKARGDDHAESDLDLLVVLRGEVPPDWRDARALSFIAADVGLEAGVDVSAKCVSAERFDGESATAIGFASRVAREGLMLWPTT